MINFLTNLFNKETQPKSKSNPNKDYWEEQYLEERKKVIAKIEEDLKKVFEDKQVIFRSRLEKKFPEEKHRSFDYMFPIGIYNYLKNLAETAQEYDIYHVGKIIDIFILNTMEENIKNSHRNWMEEQRENIKKFREDLNSKEKELNEREAKIIKIEAAQKILNSNLVDKINSEGDKND